MPALPLHEDALRSLMTAARTAWPREAIGILAAPAQRPEAWPVTHFEPLPNTAPHPERFAVDPIAFAAAEVRLRRAGLAFRGFAHTHPTSPATPSPADRAAFWPGCLQFVLAPKWWSVPGTHHQRAAGERWEVWWSVPGTHHQAGEFSAVLVRGAG